VEAHRTRDAVPAYADARSVAQLELTPFVQGVADVVESRDRPARQDAHLDLAAQRDQVVRADVVVAELLEGITAHAVAAAGLETVLRGQGRDRQLERLAVQVERRLAHFGVRRPDLRAE